MRSFPKSAILALGAVLGLQAAVTNTQGAPEAAKDPKKPGAADKPGKGKKEKEEPKPRDKNAPMELNIPVPKGEEQKTVKFPMYGADGFLQMRFDVGVATRISEEDVKMQKLKIVTFKPGDDGKPVEDMNMDLPDAMLNQRTKDITSNIAVHIQCKDYEVTGNSMKFNLDTRQGTLGGGVKMIITDLDHLGVNDTKAKVEFQPSKPDEKPDEKPAAKPGAKPGPGTKPAPKPEAKPAPKPAIKAEPNLKPTK